MAEPTAGRDDRSRGPDQARLPVFRLLLFLQVAVGLFFGLGPFVAPETTAIVFGYPGAEHFIYRIAGAATLGYAVAAALALRRPSWQRVRIPMAGTFTFNVAAVFAALVTLLDEPPPQPALLYVILAAAALFGVLSGYWLVRDRGGRAVEDRPVDPVFRGVLAAGSLAAAGFGLAPLLAPGAFAALGGFPETDAFIYRLAGAATLGYAVAGILEMRAAWWNAIRVQNAAAVTFNLLSAVGAMLYFLGGGQSLIALVILVAASLFSVALGSWQWRARR